VVNSIEHLACEPSRPGLPAWHTSARELPERVPKLLRTARVCGHRIGKVRVERRDQQPGAGLDYVDVVARFQMKSIEHALGQNRRYGAADLFQRLSSNHILSSRGGWINIATIVIPLNIERS